MTEAMRDAKRPLMTAPLSPARVERATRVAIRRQGNVVPVRSGEPWLYCGRCGKPMGWYRLPRTAFRRSTGEQVPLFAWECPAYLAGNPGSSDRHDAMSRHVYDPALPVAETT